MTRQSACNGYEADKPAKPLSGSRGDNATTGAGSGIVIRTWRPQRASSKLKPNSNWLQYYDNGKSQQPITS